MLLHIYNSESYEPILLRDYMFCLVYNSIKCRIIFYWTQWLPFRWGNDSTTVHARNQMGQLLSACVIDWRRGCQCTWLLGNLFTESLCGVLNKSLIYASTLVSTYIHTHKELASQLAHLYIYMYTIYGDVTSRCCHHWGCQSWIKWQGPECGEYVIVQMAMLLTSYERIIIIYTFCAIEKF